MKFFVALVLSLAVCGFMVSQQTPGTVGGWIPIQYNPDNKELRDLLYFGVQESVTDAIAAGQLSNGIWNCTNVNSLKAQLVAGMNYNFNVNLQDQNGDTAVMDFVVFDLLGEGTMALDSWEVLKM